MSVIFDLDLTLVDSSIAEEARQGRNWPLVYSLIPQFTLYDGMRDVFDFIRNAGIEVAIVSTAPSIYVRKVIDHFSIPVHTVIGYDERAIANLVKESIAGTLTDADDGIKITRAYVRKTYETQINDAKEILTLLQS